MKKLMVGMLLCLLAACSSGMSGTYTDQSGVSTYTFSPDGTVVMEMMGVTQNATYEKEGDLVRVTMPEQGVSLNFTVADDGSLSGPMGLKLTEKTD